MAQRSKKLGPSREEIEKQDYAEGTPGGIAIGCMVDASEVAYVSVFLESNQASALPGEVLVRNGEAENAVYY